MNFLVSAYTDHQQRKTTALAMLSISHVEPCCSRQARISRTRPDVTLIPEYLCRTRTCDLRQTALTYVSQCTPAFKHIGAVYTMCTHFRQHEVLTRAEWTLASTGDVGPVYISERAFPVACRPVCLHKTSIRVAHITLSLSYYCQ